MLFPTVPHACFTDLCYILESLTLRKQPFSFTEGLASAFDYTPISQKYNVSPTSNAADARAIASDFIVTGNDMRAALADYARAQ